jgi:hypothetical protein
MTFVNKFSHLGEKSPIFRKYSLHLNEVRKNLAASASRSCHRLNAPAFGAPPSERRIATSL